MRKALIPTSKFLSMVLRHDPDAIGLTLDPEGWADIDALLDAARRHKRPISRTDLEEVVRTNDKGRFSIDGTKTRIRARQGHSINVDLGLSPTTPPDVLYHGTVERFLDAIRADGLRPGTRQHVHLSPTTEVARKVGARRGRPVILSIRAADMARAGLAFYLSENGVWLTDAVPPDYIDFGSDY